MPAPMQARVPHVVWLAGIFALAATPALAQQSNGGISQLPSTQLQTPTPVTPPEQHLFGDWGGVRTYLGNLGIDLTFDFTSEFSGNVSGGTKQGATAAN